MPAPYTTLSGMLSDYALMDEGEHKGYYAARIDDKPYPVMSHVTAFLTRLAKGERVDARISENGWISHIQRARGTETAEKMKKAGFGPDTHSADEVAKERETYNARGTSPAPEGGQEVMSQKEAEDLIRRGEIAAAKSQVQQEKPKADCTSPKAPVEPCTLVPAQTFKPAVTGPQTFNEDQVALIKATVARNCTNTEFQLLMYLAAEYHLDPIRRQIWAVKYGDNPASIFTGRDGFLEIAHRSGVFDGMESGVKKEGDEIVGWAKVYRKDMAHAFYVEVYLKEYTTGKNLWQTKPRIMIQKVAESSCLRRAFSVSGLYCPEEMAEQAGGA